MLHNHQHAGTQAPQHIHLALIEEDAEFRGAVISAFQHSPSIRITGVAATRADGLQLLEQAPADVLLVALSFPDGAGIELIRSASRLWPGCGIMVSTAFGDQPKLLECIEAGAVGYLLKDDVPSFMLEEIRNVSSGGGSINPLIARRLLTRFGGLAMHAGAALSARETHILDLITKGFTADEVARQTQMSRHTILSFIRRIYARLAVEAGAPR